MKKLVFVLVLLFACASVVAEPVSQFRAASAASAYLQRLDYGGTICSPRSLGGESIPLAWVFALQPQGYIVVSGDDELPPVLAYSFSTDFDSGDNPWLPDLIETDLTFRLSSQNAWQRQNNLLQWTSPAADREDFQYWPPWGYSASGGWIKTEWHQSAPYNNSCPIDPVTGQRSQAGCPAVAMAQIVNFHRRLNATNFSDADDYHHNYAGRNFWIDDDHAAHGFPAWPELNADLDTLSLHYAENEAASSADAAALIWACGAAAHQVYTSAGSGTFAVSQAFAAFQRFGYDGCELLTASSPDLYTRMVQNIKDAKPVHLAVVTPAWDAGHNIVVDGYKTDGFYHVNFGWGGSQSGWYLLPDQLPYNLSVVEGAIVDIAPNQYLLAILDTIFFMDAESVMFGRQLKLLNISNTSLTIDRITWTPDHVVDAIVYCGCYPGPPRTLNPGQSLILSVSLGIVDGKLRELVQGCIYFDYSFGCFVLPFVVDGDLPILPADDPVLPAVRLSAWPNPFGEKLELTANINGPLRVNVYNLKGRKIDELEGTGKLCWEPGLEIPPGIYLLKEDGAKNGGVLRVVKIR